MFLLVSKFKMIGGGGGRLEFENLNLFRTTENS